MKLMLTIILIIVITNQGFSQSKLNLSANYETIGATLLLDSSDLEKDAYATLEYKESKSNKWLVGFPLSRVNNDLNMCSGSIFWLVPNTTYDVKIQLFDTTTIVLDGTVLQGMVTTRAEPNLRTGSGTTYHVNPTGNGTFYTLQEAINIAQARDLILLDTGSYFVGDITFPNNGNESDHIYIKGVNRDKVILNGAHEIPLVWTPYGANGVYQATTLVENPNLVIADGVRLYPHQAFPDLVSNKITLNYIPTREYPIKVGGFYRNPTMLPLFNFGDPAGINKNKLYIKFLDNSDPNEKNIEVTKQASCFKIQDNHHITFSNLTFKNYGNGHIATAIIVSNSENIVIDSCNFKANNTSVRLNAGTNNILIQNSDFKDYFFNWNAWMIKATQDSYAPFNERFPYNSRNLERGSLIYSHDFYGNNIVFRRNNIQDYHQGGHISPSPPAGSILDTIRKSLEIDFYDNTINNCRGDGFEIDGFARNVRVFRNRFDECHAPLSLAAAEEGPLYILRNVFSNIIPDLYDDSNNLSRAIGHPLKFQVGGNKINGDIFFYHNTVDAQNIANGMNVYHVTTPDAWKTLDSKNNIFVTDSGIALNIRTISGAPNFISNYNNYHTNNTNIACVNLDNNSPVYYSSLIDLFSNYGWDEHSLQADPLFVNTANEDYNLNNGSPMIDSGILIQGINETDFNGVRPDIGAFESNNLVSVPFVLNASIKIYPNPTSNFMNIELLNHNTDWSYIVFDIHGKSVVKSNIYQKITLIDLTHLATGIYIIQVKTINEVVTTKIVIKR